MNQNPSEPPHKTDVPRASPLLGCVRILLSVLAVISVSDVAFSLVSSNYVSQFAGTTIVVAVWLLVLAFWIRRTNNKQ